MLRANLAWTIGLEPEREAVFIHLTFAMGIGGLLELFEFLEAARFGDWDRAAQELLESAWAMTVGERALVLAEQLRTAEWQ